jgi:hypothetical protein
MGLNKDCKDMPYLTGRLIAVTEYYAEKHFGPSTLSEMFKYPKRYIGVFWRYVNHKDPLVMEIGVEPMERLDNNEQGQALVGYYHQRAYMYGKGRSIFGKEEVTIEHHTPERIDVPADTDNTIDDLKR